MADDSERQLGVLIGKVDEIGRRLDRSDESRRGLHLRMDGLATDIAEVKSSVDHVDRKVTAVADDVAEMKPEVALVKGIKGKAAGAVVVLGSIGAFLAWLFGNFWEPIRTGLSRIFH